MRRISRSSGRSRPTRDGDEDELARRARPGNAGNGSGPAPDRPLAGEHRPQDHRPVLHDHGFRLLPVRRGPGAVHRAELYEPGRQVVSPATFDELFTMHGSVMMFLFAGPFAFGLANYLVPLQVGAKDMAFPRLNLLSYWLYLGGGLVMVSGFFTAEGPADFGWFAYTRCRTASDRRVGGDLWIAGIVLTGLSGILTGVNVLTTVSTMRTREMTLLRDDPPGTWWSRACSCSWRSRSWTAAGALLFADRHLDGRVRRCQRRRAHPLAAPLLVVRPPGGVHPHPSLLRDHHRRDRGIRPPARLQVPGPRPRHGHRRPVDGRLGAPHVRHRRGCLPFFSCHC